MEIKRKGVVSKSTVRDTWNKRLEAHRDEYVEGGFLATDGDNELWRINARVGALNDVDYGLFLNDLRAKVEPVLAAERTRILTQQAKAAKEKPDRRSHRRGRHPLGRRPVATGNRRRLHRTGAGRLQGPASNAGRPGRELHLRPADDRRRDDLVFRDLSAGLILLVPSVFPVMIVFGLMGWFGVTIDVGTIMTPTVALGVSVDDVVHFLIWYRRGLSEGKSRHDSVMLAYEGCARAMYQSWSVLGLGLAVFALSSFVPTQRFGAMMFCLLTAALVGNLLILPAVLCSPIAALFGRGLMRKGALSLAAQNAEELPEEQFGLEPTGAVPSKSAASPVMASAVSTGLRAAIWVRWGQHRSVPRPKERRTPAPGMTPLIARQTADVGPAPSVHGSTTSGSWNQAAFHRSEKS